MPQSSFYFAVPAALSIFLVQLISCASPSELMQHRHEKEFFTAAKRGDTKYAKRLLDYGLVGVNFKDEQGWTALHYASLNGYAEMVQLLLREGAVPDETTRDGEIAQQLAEKQGHQPVVQMLRKAKAAYQTEAQPRTDRKPTPDVVVRLVSEAQIAQEEGRYDASIKALRRALVIDPQYSAAYKQAAALSLYMCDSDGAINLLDAGLKNNPRDVGLKRELETSKGQKEANIHASDKLACQAQSLNREGIVLAKQQRPLEAHAKFEEAVRIAPGPLPKAQYNAGLVLEQVGKPHEALNHYIAAHQSVLLPEEEDGILIRIVGLAHKMGIMPPQSADERYRFGIVRAQQKRYLDAIEAFQSAIAEAPWIVDAYYNLGIVYDFQGWYPEALRVLTIYARIAPYSSNLGTVKTKIVELKDKLGLIGQQAK